MKIDWSKNLFISIVGGTFLFINNIAVIEHYGLHLLKDIPIPLESPIVFFIKYFSLGFLVIFLSTLIVDWIGLD